MAAKRSENWRSKTLAAEGHSAPTPDIEEPMPAAQIFEPGPHRQRWVDRDHSKGCWPATHIAERALLSPCGERRVAVLRCRGFRDIRRWVVRGGLRPRHAGSASQPPTHPKPGMLAFTVKGAALPYALELAVRRAPGQEFGGLYPVLVWLACFIAASASWAVSSVVVSKRANAPVADVR